MVSVETARKMYDQFEGTARDMPFGEFYRELNNLTSQQKTQEDLAAIQKIIANKSIIDRSLE